MRTILCLVMLGIPLSAGHAAEPIEMGTGRTPPRLSFTDGSVSFWRPGAPEWTRALVNTPLAPGDELATGAPGALEIQVGARAFIRAWADAHFGLSNQEPDFLQVKLTGGHAALDLRSLAPGETVEVDTPNAAITLEHPGYYRVDVGGGQTAIITRRGGRGLITPASGGSLALNPSEEAVIAGMSSPQIASYVAPPLDEWDNWNYARTNSLLDAVSARYVAPGTYGAEELDRYGTWRTLPEYGPVWIPTGVPAGWVPYSTGSWVLDPWYGWTWVSGLPWGWAPFHYGRWVHVSGYWGWTPGPVVVRPVYAPALVAFLGTPAVGVRVTVGAPLIGWVALGWGEPCVPWWGPAAARRPSWAGWGGPRVVNNVVIQSNTLVNVQQINVYQNTTVQNAVVAVPHTHFGQGPITAVAVRPADARQLQPLHTGVPVQPTAASWAPSRTRGPQPPEARLRQTVVATRAPQEPAGTAAPVGRPGPSSGSADQAPVPHIVPLTKPTDPAAPLSRPAFGQSSNERNVSGPAMSPPPRRGPEPAQAAPRQPTTTSAPAPVSSAPQPTPNAHAAEAPRGARPAPQASTRPAPAVQPSPVAPVASPKPRAAPASVPTQAQGPAAPALNGPPQQNRAPAPTAPSGPAQSASSAGAGHPSTPAKEAHQGKPALPGEPANRIAPYHIEAQHPAPPQPGNAH